MEYSYKRTKLKLNLKEELTTINYAKFFGKYIFKMYLNASINIQANYNSSDNLNNFSGKKLNTKIRWKNKNKS